MKNLLHRIFKPRTHLEKMVVQAIEAHERFAKEHPIPYTDDQRRESIVTRVLLTMTTSRTKIEKAIEKLERK